MGLVSLAGGQNSSACQCLWLAYCCHSVAKSCLTCDPVECNLPGSSAHEIFQARILSGLPFPSPVDLPNPGIKPISSAWQMAPLLLCHQGSPIGGLLWLYLALGPSGQQSPHRPILDTPAFCTPLAPSLLPAKFMHLRAFSLYQKEKKSSNHFCTDYSPRLPSRSVWWLVCGNRAGRG